MSPGHEPLSLAAELRALQCALVEDGYRRRGERLRHVDAAVTRLGELADEGAVVRQAPAALAVSAGLDHVLIVRAEGDRLAVAASSAEGAEGVAPLELAAQRLAYPLVEAEAARGGGAVVRTSAEARRGAGAVRLRDGAAPHGLVVVPFELEGGLGGFVHGCRAEARGPLDELDAEAVTRFARGFADAFERVALRRRLARAGERIRATVEDLEALLAPPAAGPAATSSGLTARERAIIELVAQGRANSTVAAALTISEGTVKYHMKSILRKLDARTRTEAVYRYLGDREPA